MAFQMGASPSKEQKFKGTRLDLEAELMDGALANPQVKRSELYGAAARTKMAGAGMAQAGNQMIYSGGQFAKGQGQQDKMLAYLQSRAAGKGGPSAAETQLRTQAGQAQMANRAIAAGNRSNPFAAMRAAAMANDTAQLETNQQARAVALQDQQNSQAMLAQYLSDMRASQQGMASMQNQRQMQGLGLARSGAEFFANREADNRIANQRGQIAATDREMDLDAVRLADYEAQVRRWKRDAQNNQSAYLGGIQSLVGSIL